MIFSRNSTFTMIDFYKVLSWLPSSNVDREEPVDFTSETVQGESIVFPTIHQDFEGSDYVQVYLNCHNVDVDVTSISLSFSPLVNGNTSLCTVNCSNTSLDADIDSILTFPLDYNNTMEDTSRAISGVESINIDFGKDVTGVEIFKIVLRSNDYVYTLKDIETACISGENYVLRRLNNMKNEKDEIREVPELLQDYIYMAAGAYAWLTRWEAEAKPMKEPKSESNNYADRLFNQVDTALENYLSNIENNRHQEYIKTELFAVAYRKW